MTFESSLFMKNPATITPYKQNDNFCGSFFKEMYYIFYSAIETLNR